VFSPHPRAVLLVEDEGLVAHDLQQCLRDLGYDAYGVAASAEEAMARAAERHPDIALVDIRIKGRLDGIKTAQLLQERFRVPIVYMTGNADDTTLQRALQTRPHGFLVKPIRTAELQSMIEIALNGGGRPDRGGSREGAGIGPAEEPEAEAPTAEAVRGQLERIFASSDFDAPRRSREFLRFVADEVIAGRGDDLTQVAIAVEVFGRKSDFDAIVDPIVRIQAGRLRRSLERYYLLSGKGDPVRIELPKGTYAPVFRTPVRAEEPPATPPGSPAARDVANDWPAVVVCAFEATGHRAEAHDLAAEVTEEVALELGRHRVVRVLPQRDRDGRPSPAADHARFVLGGRLRADGDGVRISAHLFDRATGEQVWGDEYQTSPQPGRWSGTTEDVARVVAGRVGSEEGVVVQILARERRGPRAALPAPYDAILRSYDFVLARDPKELAPAIGALRRLVELEPECGPAWTRLGRLLLGRYALDVTANPATLDEAVRCAQRGVRTEPASRSARCVLAAALLVKGERASARDEVEEALRNGPDSLVYLERVGILLTMLGDAKRGPALSRSARLRNPHGLPDVQVGLWADQIREGLGRAGRPPE
jgi:adenylate cyclase